MLSDTHPADHEPHTHQIELRSESTGRYKINKKLFSRDASGEEHQQTSGRTIIFCFDNFAVASDLTVKLRELKEHMLSFVESSTSFRAKRQEGVGRESGKPF